MHFKNFKRNKRRKSNAKQQKIPRALTSSETVQSIVQPLGKSFITWPLVMLSKRKHNFKYARGFLAQNFQAKDFLSLHEWNNKFITFLSPQKNEIEGCKHRKHRIEFRNVFILFHFCCTATCSAAKRTFEFSLGFYFSEVYSEFFSPQIPSGTLYRQGSNKAVRLPDFFVAVLQRNFYLFPSKIRIKINKKKNVDEIN